VSQLNSTQREAKEDAELLVKMTERLVQIEIRAAEIVAGMIHALSHDMSVEELVGWMRCGDNRARGSYPKSSSWQAGWLAAFIFGDVMKENAQRYLEELNELEWRRIQAGVQTLPRQDELQFAARLERLWEALSESEQEEVEQELAKAEGRESLVIDT